MLRKKSIYNSRNVLEINDTDICHGKRCAESFHKENLKIKETFRESESLNGSEATPKL
jgi:hypothetical protein